MPGNRHRYIRPWPFVAVLALWTGIAWVIASVYTARTIDTIYRQQLVTAQQHFDSLNEGIDDALNSLSGIPSVLSLDVQVRETLLHFGDTSRFASWSVSERKQRWETTPELTRLNQRFLSAAKLLQADAIWLLNGAGDCIAASNGGSDKSFIGGNYADRHYFTQNRAGLPGSQYLVGRVSRVPGLYFSSPVMVDGRFIGAVIVKRDLTHFQRWTRHVNAFITDANGVIV